RRNEMAKTKMTTEELLSVFEEMTVLELKEFLDAFEEKFEVTAAAPVAVAAAPAAGGAGGDGAAAAEEKDSFDVVITDAGAQKIQVIKEVRSLTNLGLKEAKDLVDGAPAKVLEGADPETAQKAKEVLEGAGATVELQQAAGPKARLRYPVRGIRYRDIRKPPATPGAFPFPSKYSVPNTKYCEGRHLAPYSQADPFPHCMGDIAPAGAGAEFRRSTP